MPKNGTRKYTVLTPARVRMLPASTRPAVLAGADTPLPCTLRSSSSQPDAERHRGRRRHADGDRRRVEHGPERVEGGCRAEPGEHADPHGHAAEGGRRLLVHAALVGGDEVAALDRHPPHDGRERARRERP